MLDFIEDMSLGCLLGKYTRFRLLPGPTQPIHTVVISMDESVPRCFVVFTFSQLRSAIFSSALYVSDLGTGLRRLTLGV